MIPNQDRKSALKLAQMCEALNGKSHIKIIEKILEKPGDINYTNSSIQGWTVLHHVCSEKGYLGPKTVEPLVKLLKHGADFTKKNDHGQTALHMMIEKHQSSESPVDNPFFNSILSAHVNTNNFSNPSNKDRLSHFHIACMTNNTTAVQFFLENGVSVDEPVSMDSKFSPGYTPLHFATINANTKVVEILFAHGSNLHAADASGMTPLHLLVKRKLEMLDSIRNAVPELEGDSYKKLQEQLDENDKIINMLMENISSDNDSLDTIGLSSFHVACILQDTSAAKHLLDQVEDLNHCVNSNSQLWAGYSALHFAAHVSIDRMEMLINAGANLSAKDSKGLSPLDMCIEKYKIEDVCRIVSLNANWEGIVFSDGHTKLLSFVRILADLELFKKFINRSKKNINMCIPVESSLWPGYTLLHMAVLFAKISDQRTEKEVKNEVDLQIIASLSKGSDLSIQDSRGQTALHLAFRLDKMPLVESILQHCPRIPVVSDEDNLSHLHIVCSADKRKSRLKKCVPMNSDVNVAYKGASPVNIVWPGSTPLHVCLVNKRDKSEVTEAVNVLLKRGADPYIKDAYGLTPFHWLLKQKYYQKFETLLKQASNDCVAEKYGLSHLHVACALENASAVNRYLNNGADVNLAVKYSKRSVDDPLSFLSRYDKYTPLLFATLFSASDAEKLLKRGADVFAESADGSTAFNCPYSHMNFLNHFVQKVRKNTAADLQRIMREKFGWTSLHLACHELDVDRFKKIVKANLADVNARVHSSSPVWKGYTPLHLLMHRFKNSYNTIIKEIPCSMSRVLLEHGADVTLVDEEQDSPISMVFKYNMCDHAREQLALLMKHHRDFNVNPVNIHGVSHFHMACYANDVDAVLGFIQHGVDVNRAIDYFASDWYAGDTPLHLATKIHIVDLLINHGADMHIENVKGLTVLHNAFWGNPVDDDIVTKIVENGADINSPNFKGETPFQIAMWGRGMTIDKLKYCIEKGCHVNSCNPITGVGYAAQILAEYYRDENLQKLIVQTILNETSTNIFGRTALHHFVTKRPSDSFDHYDLFIEKLIQSNQEVDQQDEDGKTALHVAVEFGNEEAVHALLSSGADINVVDLKGNSVLSYATDFDLVCSKDIKSFLSVHACRLALLKLDISKINADAISGESKSGWDHANNRDFYEQIAMSKDFELGVRSMCLGDFLTEMGAVVTYPSLSQSERCKIDQYFESINNESLKEIQGFLKLQHRKAAKRIELLSLVTNAFRLLLGFDIPYLCTENIFRYLHNSDLKNVIIGAEIDNENMRMDVD